MTGSTPQSASSARVLLPAGGGGNRKRKHRAALGRPSRKRFLVRRGHPMLTDKRILQPKRDGQALPVAGSALRHPVAVDFDFHRPVHHQIHSVPQPDPALMYGIEHSALPKMGSSKISHTNSRGNLAVPHCERANAPEPTSPRGSGASYPDRDDPRWRDMYSAPLDGSPVWLWVVHSSARYSKDPIGQGFEAACRAEWIDHNGGGWTWQGVAGALTKWMPRDDGLNIYGQPIHSTA